MKPLYTLGIVCALLAGQSLQAQTFINFSFNQDPPMLADAGIGDSICAGDDANLLGTGSGGNGTISYLWTPSGNVTNPNSASTTANPSTTTVYTLTVSDGNNCSTTDTMMVTLPSVPFGVDAGSNQSVCEGGNLILNANATGGYGGNTYVWSPGSIFSDSTISNPTITPDSTVIVTVTVTDAFLCTTTDNVTITVLDCSGIEDETVELMQIYPNPNNGVFTMILNDGNETHSFDVKIFSVNGSVVYQQTSLHAGTYPINLDELKSGVYMISVYNSGTQIFSKSMIIQ